MKGWRTMYHRRSQGTKKNAEQPTLPQNQNTSF
jgi:hypothetical protein